MHVDVAGPGRVGGARERTHERRVLDLGEKEDGLPRLHVGADAHCQFGVGLEARV